jgi:hypothetical protein
MYAMILETPGGLMNESLLPALTLLGAVVTFAGVAVPWILYLRFLDRYCLALQSTNSSVKPAELADLVRAYRQPKKRLPMSRDTALPSADQGELKEGPK